MADSRLSAGGRPASLVCLALLWMSVTGPEVYAQDCPRPTAPNMHLVENDILRGTFPDGVEVRFECALGYTAGGGSPGITCTAGEWSPVTLVCTKSNCGSADEILNGHVNYAEGTSFGDKISFSCNLGFTLVGQKQQTCRVEGWSGRPPSCEVVKCTSVPPVANADSPVPMRQEYNYGAVIKYRCLKDFTMNGSATVSCSETGTFISPPTCIKVSCREPVVPAVALWVSGSRFPYQYLSTVVYKCPPSFTMKGSGSMTCQLNNTWTRSPECIDERVPVSPPTPPSGTSKWWQSWWFIIICIIAVLVAIGLCIWKIKCRRAKTVAVDML